MVSAMDQGGEMLSLLIAQCHYVFLYRDLFPGHQSAPSAATEPSNQTNTAESMTGATRGVGRGNLRPYRVGQRPPNMTAREDEALVAPPYEPELTLDPGCRAASDEARH